VRYAGDLVAGICIVVLAIVFYFLGYQTGLERSWVMDSSGQIVSTGAGECPICGKQMHNALIKNENIWIEFYVCNHKEW